jgi:hypothetical protein
MHLSTLHKIDGDVHAVRTTGVDREDWAVSLHLGSASNALYISYEQAKSLWFSLGAALSDIEYEGVIATTSLDGSLNDNGTAIHMAHDLVGEGFDGTGLNPADTAMTLAEFIVRLTEPTKKDERYCLEAVWSEGDVRALCTLPLGHTGDHKAAE